MKSMTTRVWKKLTALKRGDGKKLAGRKGLLAEKENRKHPRGGAGRRRPLGARRKRRAPFAQGRTPDRARNHAPSERRPPKSGRMKGGEGGTVFFSRAYHGALVRTRVGRTSALGERVLGGRGEVSLWEKVLRRGGKESLLRSGGGSAGSWAGGDCGRPANPGPARERNWGKKSGKRGKGSPLLELIPPSKKRGEHQGSSIPYVFL